jgi:para-aminobenzoate synthetase / 4-amino-4-deoxychorismate lyase
MACFSPAAEPVQATFSSFHPLVPGWSCRLAGPTSVLEATTISQVLPLLHAAWEASLSGKWVALALSYEAAPAFDPAMRTHPPGEFPLAWAAVFDRTCDVPESGQEGAAQDAQGSGPHYAVGPWNPLVERAEYDRAIERIHELIVQGETYQVNYTMPFRASFIGDECAWHMDLARAQGAPFSAFLRMGRFSVLSLSPELFFRLDGREIVSMPMKGTMARGRWPGEDLGKAEELAACPKNRAENVMIVDLVRSDLGRIAVTGSVRAEPLFEVQTLRSVHQMVSTVRATLAAGATLIDIMRAIFPGGSITGAPKIRTMEIIHELEHLPRHLYTGALGFLRPGGGGVFSIPIRTVLLDRLASTAEMRVGGGITAGSTSEGEYEECLLKMRFLSDRPGAFCLLETILLREGECMLLERHLKRLRESAAYFLIPFSEEKVLRSLQTACREHPSGCHKLRLLLSREGRPRAEASVLDDAAPARRLRLGLANEPVSSTDVFLFHKTTRRGIYEKALSARPTCDEVLLFNERGELTEATRANLVLDIAGELVTPPVECGLLAGTFRQELLESGVIGERILHPFDLARARRILLINSIRGWIEASMAERG